MTAQPIPTLGRGNTGIPRPRTGSSGAVISDGTTGLRPQPGESDPARMLSWVLLLVMATIVMALTLVWWLV